MNGKMRTAVRLNGHFEAVGCVNIELPDMPYCINSFVEYKKYYCYFCSENANLATAWNGFVIALVWGMSVVRVDLSRSQFCVFFTQPVFN